MNMPLALILHGAPPENEYFDAQQPSPSNAHFVPWLQKELLLKGYEAQTPEMPAPYLPEYRAWRKVFERYELRSDSLLVGHSCGAGFLVRWLSENRRKIARLVLVAPWLDPYRNGCAGRFFYFKIDPKLSTRAEVHLVYSDNDGDEINKSVDIIREALPNVHAHLFEDCGHFCKSEVGAELPLLRDIVLG